MQYRQSLMQSLIILPVDSSASEIVNADINGKMLLKRCRETWSKITNKFDNDWLKSLSLEFPHIVVITFNMNFISCLNDLQIEVFNILSQHY